MLRSAFVILLFSVICTQALTITYPNSTGWNKNVGRMTVLWSVDPQDPAMFSIELRDVGAGSVVNPLALAGNVESALGQLTIDVPPVPVSETYQMMFVDVTNVNRILANSSVFPIYPDPPSATSETVTQSMFTIPSTSLVATTLATTTLATTIPATTTSATISSATTTPATTSPATTSSAASTPVASSTLASTTPSTTSIPSSSEPITRSTSSRMLTSVSGTSTPTIGIDPGATFVPINDGLRCRSSDNWVGMFVGGMGFLVSVLTVL